MIERTVRKHRKLSRLAVVAVVLAALFVVVAVAQACMLLPPSLWFQAVGSSSIAPHSLLFRDSFLPRVVIAISAGAGLALAGTVFQQVLHNPLAEPATLGVSGGGQLALASAMLWSPSLYGAAQSVITLAGSATAFLIVIGIASSLEFSAVGLVVSGLIVSLLCGSLSAILILLNHEYLSMLFIWQSGDLAQNGWSSATWLLVQTTPMAISCGLLARPLQMLGMHDDGARSLGISVLGTRIGFLALAVALSAVITSAVGVVGFVGLAAPALTRMLGARLFKQRLVWAPVFGALLLALADQIAQALTFFSQPIPAGAITALLGTPLLIWLVSRARPDMLPPQAAAVALRARNTSARTAMIWALLLLVGALFLSLTCGHMAGGWQFASRPEFQLLARWRVPRVFVSLACGVMISTAGVLMQRMTANPMASPELLGISSGATVSVILAMLIVPGFDPIWTFPVAGLGAAITLAALLGIAGRSTYSSDRLLIVGVTLALFMTAVSSIALMSGDPRVSFLISWMSGSTYGVTEQQAVLACVAAILVLLLTSLSVRWLEILPLGTSRAIALGIKVAHVRLALLLLTAGATSAATLVIGPLSFVGLIAPHTARMLGLQRPMEHFLGAAILGAFTMVLADWIGRNILAPWQLPAGLIASLIGAPHFLWLLRRRTR